jgi:sigma-B regulation protein RsbU (phosphoserine phosphatase)
MPADEKKSVLVVDDDITIRKLVSHHLKINNYNVHSAANPEEAFTDLDKNHVDIVLCDISMDKMDGFEFCEIVRRNEKFRSTPFVFISAKNTIEDKSKALEVGGDDYITKPFNVDELMLKVKSMIRRTEINRIYGGRKNIQATFSNALSKILVVDDDKSLLNLLQHNLNTAGYECRTADNVNEGMKIIKSFIPDLIIADVLMPEIDGFQFRDMLLKDPALASVPFVFLSHKASEEEILEGYSKDITDYILKDSKPQLFLAKVNAIIRSLAKERKKIVDEIHQAADYWNKSLTPDDLSGFENFSIKFWHEPFTGIPGGDFIDHFQLDKNHLAIVVGDVMGKKWGAWYFAYAYAGYIRSAVRSIIESGELFSPGKIISKVNNLVYKDSKVSEVFSTLSVLVIDNKNKSVKYSGAGDLPLFYKNGKTNEVRRIDSKGLLLGFAQDSEFNDFSMNISEGDLILLTTDGIIESTDLKGNQFGTQRLIQLMEKLDSNIPSMDTVKSELVKFTSGKFDDDISLVLVSAK